LPIANVYIGAASYIACNVKLFVKCVEGNGHGLFLPSFPFAGNNYGKSRKVSGKKFDKLTEQKALFGKDQRKIY